MKKRGMKGKARPILIGWTRGVGSMPILMAASLLLPSGVLLQDAMYRAGHDNSRMKTMMYCMTPLILDYPREGALKAPVASHTHHAQTPSATLFTRNPQSPALPLHPRSPQHLRV
jgi:hypothetical protein